MSVYKEGYYIADQITKASVQIFPDACDFGAPVRQGDALWNMVKQLTEWYGIKGTRKVERYATGRSCEYKVQLMDEWAVSDERKTVKEATQTFHVSFVSCTTGRCKGFDGYVYIQEITL